ncbi:YHS domain-containing (seleno)protein [Aestuariivirga sp.]|uniref:YHS domain-containing (seleno)protein n=1 Tax=Aestuariivirga sp. TaxID=2650926 RepID=UPI0035932359
MFKNSIAGLAFAIAMATSAWAGPQFIDSSKFAVSGFDTVSYFDLSQSAIGSPQASPLPGKASITAEYNGVKFAFATEDNRKRFLADPAKFAPQYDGHCAFGVAKGGKVPGNPKLWRIVDGKLYLNIKDTVVSQWEENIPGNIKTAQKNWKKLESKAASKAVIPNFTSSAPTP